MGLQAKESSSSVNSPGENRHMPQLDSLRALAVFAVMIEHYIPGSDLVRGNVPFGELGVRLFFVLSGFLITGILMRCRPPLEMGAQSLGGVLGNFFARRFIRLMPVYNVYLSAFALMMPDARQYLGQFALYLQNFLFAAQPEVFAKFLAHFWSLAVEEQFYLVWPFVILLTPRASLAWVVGLLALAGPLFRAGGLWAGFAPHSITMMMPAHFDTLALGGLFAVLDRGDASDRAFGARLARLGLPVGLALTIVTTVAQERGSQVFGTILGELGMGLLFLWVVTGAARGFGGVGGLVLNAAPLRYLGKISYGLYVYHFNVPWLIREKVAPALQLTLPEEPWMRLPIFALVTVMIAALSWQFVEKPLNQLKDRFPYFTPTSRQLPRVARLPAQAKDQAT